MPWLLVVVERERVWLFVNAVRGEWWSELLLSMGLGEYREAGIGGPPDWLGFVDFAADFRRGQKDPRMDREDSNGTWGYCPAQDSW